MHGRRPASPVDGSLHGVLPCPSGRVNAVQLVGASPMTLTLAPDAPGKGGHRSRLSDRTSCLRRHPGLSGGGCSLSGVISDRLIRGVNTAEGGRAVVQGHAGPVNEQLASGRLGRATRALLRLWAPTEQPGSASPRGHHPVRQRYAPAPAFAAGRAAGAAQRERLGPSCSDPDARAYDSPASPGPGRWVAPKRG